jgi:hypothetical protein
MKERFINLDTLVEQTQLLSDMELQSYLAGLSSSERSNFIASNVKDAIQKVDTEKSKKFSTMSQQLTGADNNIVSTAYYLGRTNDLNDLANKVDAVTVEELVTEEINRESNGRQYEINEWSNFNKLETLYILQVIFVGITFICVLLFLRNIGYVSESLFKMLAVVTGLLVVFVIVYRLRYTKVSRDSRYWHKMRFPTHSNPFPIQVKTSPVCIG